MAPVCTRPLTALSFGPINGPAVAVSARSVYPPYCSDFCGVVLLTGQRHDSCGETSLLNYFPCAETSNSYLSPHLRNEAFCPHCPLGLAWKRLPLAESGSSSSSKQRDFLRSGTPQA